MFFIRLVVLITALEILAPATERQKLLPSHHMIQIRETEEKESDEELCRIKNETIE